MPFHPFPTPALLGLRFTEDPLCPPERFARLRREPGEQFEGIEGHPTRVALDRVLGFFREPLQ